MSSSNPVSENDSKLNIGGIVCSVLFIIIGVICFYETTEMTDPDSYVFPRMVISGLIGLSLIHIFVAFFRGEKPDVDELEYESVPSNPRRILLVAAMIGSSLLMHLIGFLLSGFGTFLALMLVSQYDSWTVKKLLLYTLIAALIVCGFYWMFSTILQVPLPEGSLIKFP